MSTPRRFPARRLVAVALAAGLGAAAPAGVASAETPVTTSSVVLEDQLVPGGTGPGNQTDPHLDGSLLVFTAVDGSTSGIRYVDLADGSTGTIDNGGHRDSLPDVSGDLVVFRRVLADGSTERPIMVFDVSAPELGAHVLAPSPGARRAFPSIGGTTVAFTQFVTGSSTETEVCVADARTPAAPAVCLTGDRTTKTEPSVSPDGSTVTWLACTSTTAGCDVYVAVRTPDGSWGAPVRLTDSAGEEFTPDTDGTVVTYTSNAGGDWDIWYENVDGTDERQLVLSDAPGSAEVNPTISGGAILFEREMPNSLVADLYLYRPGTGVLVRVTATPRDEMLNALSLSSTGDLRVAWAQPDDLTPGQNDIHAARARLDDGTNEPPTLSLPPGVTVDATGPAGAQVEFAASATDDGAATLPVTCTPASGAAFAIGTTTVTCTATDGAGATTTGTFGVTVRGARDQLADLLATVTGVGPGTSLADKVRAAVQSLPDTAPACDRLRSFLREVEAQSGKRIPAPTAAALVEDATRIRAVLGCR